MKKFAALLGAILAFADGPLFLPNARAVTLPYLDSFSYNEGNLIAMGGPTWILGNGSSTLEIAITNPAALISPSGFPAASARGVRRAPSGSARRAAIQYTSVPASDGNTMYVSFLLNVQSAPGGTQAIGYLDNNPTSQGSPQAGIFLDSSSRLGIGKKNSSPAFTMASGLSAGTHLVVVRYTFQSGNDRVDLWVDPSSSDYGAGTAPASLGNVTGTSDPPSLDYFQISTPGSVGGSQFMDELRLGTTWADVVPAGTPPVGTKLGFTTQPANTQVSQTITPAVVVQVQDASGNSIASNNVPITLALTAGSGTFSGTLTQNTDGTGKATFSDLSIDAAGADKQLTASASGIGAGLTDAPSSVFAVTNAPVINANGPIITQSLKVASSFVLRGINGTANASYLVLTTTNLALPVAQWTSLATNLFDGSGNFDCTNPVNAGQGQQFFRLLSGAGSSPPGLSEAIGYASFGNGTTGGGNTTNIVVVTNTASLSNALVRLKGPLIVRVQGTIALRTDQNTPVNWGNKTIEGIGTDATILGDLTVQNPTNSNVIIRNLRLTNPNATGGDKDAITINNGVTNVWVDHCDIFDCVDGGLDVVNGADFVTVSWCKFYYETITTHQNVNLIGNGDDKGSSDTGKLHITFHHNWWSTGCKERMPSVRFGRAHVFNNYFNIPDNAYCVRTRLFAEILAENNYFENVNDAFEHYVNTDTGIEPSNAHGLLFETNNILVNCTTNYTYILSGANAGSLLSSNETSITFHQDDHDFTIINVVSGNDLLSTNSIGLNPPPYAYTLDAAIDIPNLVTNNAGAGKGPFAP